jgi:hypothetical protein
MSSPFTAEIIPLPLLGAKQEPGGSSPRSAPADFLEPVALARAMRDEPTRRAIEARLNGAARHVTVPPIRPMPSVLAIDALFMVSGAIAALIVCVCLLWGAF